MSGRLRRRATVVVYRNGKLLLVSDQTGRFLLPGGGIKPGEQPMAAAVRELHEETALTATRAEYLFAWESATNRHIVFLVEASGEVEIGPEIGEFRWWDRRECLPTYRHVAVVNERLR